MSEEILRPELVMGRRILIIGDVDTGKTRLTARITKMLIDRGLSRDMTIIDFSPKLRHLRGSKIGGRISDFISIPRGVRLLCPAKVETPRASAKTPEELIELARMNAYRMANIIKKYFNKPSPILIMNDVSLYLQAGDPELLIKSVKRAETVVMNSYYGKTLLNDLGTGVSENEKRNVEKLFGEVDLIIYLVKELK